VVDQPALALERRYLASWQLTAPEPMAETPTSRVSSVLRGGRRVVLKVLKPRGNEERIGALALEYFGGDGAVRLLAHDDQAQLLELAPGPHLSEMVRAGRDREATQVIAGVLERLHADRPHAVPSGLSTLRERFSALFTVARDVSGRDADIFGRGARLAERLLSSPRDERVLHGDLHHDNVREHPQRGWLAFDPKGIWGERTYDACNTFLNPWTEVESFFTRERTRQRAGDLAGALKLPFDRLLGYVLAHACLSAAWSLGAGEPHAPALRMARIADTLLSPTA
jgi:streptomycin 6-kinase